MKNSLPGPIRKSGLALRLCVSLAFFATTCQPASAGTAPETAAIAAFHATLESGAAPGSGPLPPSGPAPKIAAKVAAEDSAADAAADLETEEGPQSANVGQRKKPEARKQPLAPGEVVVAVELNGNPVGDFAQVFRDGKGRYFATAELFSASRLPVPKVTPTQVQETLYYPLSAI